jgi:hypothetical protein
VVVELSEQTAKALQLEDARNEAAGDGRRSYDDQAAALALLQLNPLDHDYSALSEEPATARVLANAIELLDHDPHRDFGAAAQSAVETLQEDDAAMVPVVDAHLERVGGLPTTEEDREPPDNLQENLEYLLLRLSNRLASS